MKPIGLEYAAHPSKIKTFLEHLIHSSYDFR